MNQYQVNIYQKDKNPIHVKSPKRMYAQYKLYVCQSNYVKGYKIKKHEVMNYAKKNYFVYTDDRVTF